MKWWYFLLIALSIGLFPTYLLRPLSSTSEYVAPMNAMDPEELLRQNVYTVLHNLGDSAPPHVVNDSSATYASKQRGRDLFFKGMTIGPDGSTTPVQSKMFKCWACHNTVREDPDLRKYDPEARLQYAKEHGIPLLPATTVYGIVNRQSFYNGDWSKKYGPDIVAKVRHNLRQAIQLCAIGCAQGRPLKDWEIESILMFFWDLQYKMADLDWTADELEFVHRALQRPHDQAMRDSAIHLIKSKYAPFSPATFNPPPADRKAGYGLQGRPEVGRDVYRMSCLHCHKNGRFAYLYLDEDPFSLKLLRKHFPRYSRYSAYQVICWGTEPLPGKRFYMPQYTKQRMSPQQIEDLRAYLEQQAQP